ncbi:hypothetical protein K435DRAFT_679530 [Dendrothele bispora CBS 962.96]|uniref:Insulin-degrading enzyme n=1 Tax=Dendrothele bispora (strain CBS 962.96) TaxID=1314807 RepID=A0A4S8LHV4_DENBC|nr:hypothetical protein K435DRAFT_679530 [Dendrothele bispora CBS 962.96]
MATEAQWRRVSPPRSEVPPYSQFVKSIQKSQQDDREYRIIKLDNGLEATLVHDLKADKAAASLDVAVGHLSDPDDMPGLAHFCEHLLFMGTEQFPKENEYSEFLSKNNGASNAYTSTSNTNYYFSVATAQLPGALARFAGFFHCPLFAPSCTSRELNAVDSEHKKNHQSDLWRIFQVSKHLSKDGHPWRKFGSGNRESLSKAAKDLKAKQKLPLENGNAVSANNLSIPPSPIPSRISSPTPSISSTNSENDADGGEVGRETRRRLIEWWSKEYCASRMHLCVLGKESLDELEELVSTLFSPIPNRQVDPLPMFYDHPFGPDEKGTLVSVQTIMTMHVIEISIPLEYQGFNWRHKPANFLAHFIGHEGPGSLYSYLKQKHWVSGLRAGPQVAVRGFEFFHLTIYLTSEGFKNYKSVILSTYKYLSMLRESTFERYHQEEIASLSETRFRFLEKKRPDTYVTRVAELMAKPYPKELSLVAPSVTWNWNDEYEGIPSAGGQDEVQKYLQDFRLDNSRVMLMAKAGELEKIERIDRNAVWQKEPWYGTQYRVERFGEEFLAQASICASSKNDISELYLPGPNKFIPSNLDVIRRDVPEPARRPFLIRRTPMSTLWHKEDDQFWVPKAQVYIDMRSPYANSSARAAVLTRLYTQLVTDALTEFSYDADLAGLAYNFVAHTKGLYVTLQGYNDKMAVLVEEVLAKAKKLVVDPERLTVIKEENKKNWENFFLGQSYQLSDYYGRYTMTEQQWTIDEYLKELPSITPGDVQEHIKKLLSEVNIRILVVGNMAKEESIRIAEVSEADLGRSSLSASELNDKALLLPTGCNYTWRSKILNPNQANSALTYYTHIGPVSNRHLRVTSALLAQILSEPAFDILRTKEQLGYIVSSSGWTLPGASEKGLRIVVQSERSPAYLESRVEAFLDTMKVRLEEMTLEAFEEQKSGLERKWREKYKNLTEEATTFMSHINSGHFDFYRNTIDADMLREITKDDVLSLFMSKVHPSSKTRSKLSIHMKSQKPPTKHVSTAAAQAFEVLLHETPLELNGVAWKETLGDDTPKLDAFQTYWASVLEGKEGGEALLAAIPELVAKYPLEGEGADPAQDSVTFIEDLKVFKTVLQPALDPGPMVNWGDLPAPNL